MNDNVRFALFISALLSKEPSLSVSRDVIDNNELFRIDILAYCNDIDTSLLKYLYVYMFETCPDNPNQLFYLSPDKKSIDIVNYNKGNDKIDYTITNMSLCDFSETPIVEDSRHVVVDKKNKDCLLQRMISYYTPERVEMLRLVCEDEKIRTNLDSLHILEKTDKLRIVKALYRNSDNFYTIIELMMDYSKDDVNVKSFTSSGSSLDDNAFIKSSIYDKSMLTTEYLNLIDSIYDENVKMDAYDSSKSSDKYDFSANFYDDKNIDINKINKDYYDKDIYINNNKIEELPTYQMNNIKKYINKLDNMKLDSRIYEFLDELYEKGYHKTR